MLYLPTVVSNIYRRIIATRLDKHWNSLLDRIRREVVISN